MTARRITIVHLGRPSALGGLLRVASLRSVFEGAGAEVSEIRLRIDHRTRAGNLLQLGVADVMRGTAVPECLAWSPKSAMAALEQTDPHVVICETARAYHPIFATGPWRLVLDYVDRLSVSYADRSGIVPSKGGQILFRALAKTSKRFETRPLPSNISTIAAGWTDAQFLNATWVPNSVEVHQRSPATTDTSEASTAIHDLLFFGNLSYPPNVEAVHRLNRIWPALSLARPSTTLLLAGAGPDPDLVAIAGANGWTLLADFDSLPTLLASARLGVVPLLHASGIQNKALEAAAHGLAQVVDPVVAAGFAPDFPFAVADDDRALIRHIVRLLDDDAARATLAAQSQQHMLDAYSAVSWREWANGLFVP